MRGVLAEKGLPFLLAAFAFALRLQEKAGVLVGDEAWTFLSAKSPLLFWFDVHPTLFYALSYPFAKALGASGLHLMTALLGAFGAYWAARISPYAGLFYALYPGAVAAGESARHVSLTAALLPWFLYAWRTGRGLPLAATFMALSHLTTQVFLAASLLLMDRGSRRAVLNALLWNPLVVLEGLRLIALAHAGLSGDLPERGVDAGGFLEALFLPLPLGLATAFLAGAGARGKELLPFLLAALTLLLLGRFEGYYALLLVGPVAVWVGEGVRVIGGRLAPLVALLLAANLLPWVWAYGQAGSSSRMAVEATSKASLLALPRYEKPLYHPYLANGFKGDIILPCGERFSVQAALGRGGSDSGGMR